MDVSGVASLVECRGGVPRRFAEPRTFSAAALVKLVSSWGSSRHACVHRALRVRSRDARAHRRRSILDAADYSCRSARFRAWSR